MGVEPPTPPPLRTPLLLGQLAVMLLLSMHCYDVCLRCCLQETRGLLDAKDDIILLLKQASCFGNHDATFMLSVILNYGLDVKSNEHQVIATVVNIRPT